MTFPTLVLVGDANPPFFLDAARLLAEALPDARLQILGGEGHVVDPETLTPVLADFLAT
ncbi:MAG: hypothetical protein M3P44_05315 [Actinomycetota bacterium]|nr:hypothetical protein [Actinomycetota bacterium]